MRGRQGKDQLRYDMEVTEWLEQLPETVVLPKVGSRVRCDCHSA